LVGSSGCAVATLALAWEPALAVSPVARGLGWVTGWSCITSLDVNPRLAEHLEYYIGPDPYAALSTGTKVDPLHIRVLGNGWDRARRTIRRPKLHIDDVRHSDNMWAAVTGASTRNLMAPMGHTCLGAARIEAGAHYASDSPSRTVV